MPFLEHIKSLYMGYDLYLQNDGEKRPVSARNFQPDVPRNMSDVNLFLTKNVQAVPMRIV